MTELVVGAGALAVIGFLGWLIWHARKAERTSILLEQQQAENEAQRRAAEVLAERRSAGSTVGRLRDGTF